MSAKKRLFIILTLLGLSCIGLVFILLNNQGYYHSGMDFSLKADGYHVNLVLPGSNAYKAGLRKGMVLTWFDGIDTIALNETSNTDLGAFFNIANRFFSIGKSIEAVDSFGTVYRFMLDRSTWTERLALFDRELIINLIIGALFIAFGVWLLAVGHANTAVQWFVLFCVTTGISITLSFFNSYWSAELLRFRFIGLDIAGCAACIFLILFVQHFPVQRDFNRYLTVLTPVAFIIIKYALIAAGIISFYGFSAFFIHVLLVVSFMYSLYLLIRRYTEVKDGHKRRLRWIIAGMALSLVPYIVYFVSILVSSQILTSDRATLNSICAFGILLFPVFVTIGVIKYNLFDIDRFLNKFFILFVMGLTLTLVYFLVFLIFFETKMNMGMYSLLLVTAFLSPTLYRLVDLGITRVLGKRQRTKTQILLEMEENLVGVYKIEEVYSITSSALVSAFDPSYIKFITEAKGEEHKVLYSYPAEPIAYEMNPDKKTNGSLRFHLDTENAVTYSMLIGKNKDDDIYTKEDVHLLLSAAAQISKSRENCELYRRLQESIKNETGAQKLTILALAKLTEYRDQETGRHLERINEYSRLIATRLKKVTLDQNYISDEYINDLCLSSILHDIGKVGISDSILLKPGKLSPEEFENMKSHTLIGGDVLEETETMNLGRTFLTIGKHVAYHHHEKWDGTGYPHGLKGDKIPLSARIVAIADVYDALRSDRPYKEAFPHEKAASIIIENKGTHFDPDLVDIFISVQDEFMAVSRSTVPAESTEASLEAV